MYQNDVLNACIQVGLPVNEVFFQWSDASLGETRTLFQRPEGPVCLSWTVTPTEAQYQAAQAIVNAMAPNVSERSGLDNYYPPPRVLIALLFRASSGFSGLSAARRQRIQGIIDDFAAKALSRL